MGAKSEADEIAELQALGITHPARRRQRDAEQRRRNQQKEKGWIGTPYRSRPPNLRGLKPATPEPWAIDEAFYQKQRQELGKRLASQDVVITTALVPGRRAPLLIDEDAVKGMKGGSVIVDLAAEQQGNCACTDPSQTVVAHGVQIIPGSNLPSDIPANASQMFAKNLTTFLKHLAPEGELVLDLEDEITRGAMLTHEGAIVNDRVKALVEGAG